MTLPLPLELDFPLVCLDLETTGDIARIDRVCQVALVKMYPDGKINEWETLVNPGVPIPPSVTAIHGISDEDVKDAPTFEQLAVKLASGLSKTDYCGYNVDFDLRFLTEEFRRCRLRPELFMNGRVVDAFRIFQRFAPRRLENALEHYCGERHEGAHRAMADVKATLRVLSAQVERHQLPRTVADLCAMFEDAPREDAVDPDRRLVRRGDDVVINFGKNVGRRLRDVEDSFLRWILKSEFTPAVMGAVGEELERRRRIGRQRSTED